MKRFPASSEPRVEVLPPQMAGDINSPHAPEDAAHPYLGRLPRVDELTPDWIIQRLMVEATDRGTRTRQSSRVKALEALAKITGLIDEGVPKEPDAEERAKQLDPMVRRQLIAAKVKEMIERGIIRKDDIDV